MHEGERVEFANILRGAAAICVLLSHYCGVFWFGQPLVSNLTFVPPLPLSIATGPFYVQWLNYFPLFNWGAFGVALFFLVSGFVIPFSLSKATGPSFVVNRVFRILPTYFVGFSITLFTMWAGNRYLGQQLPFSTKEVFIHYVPGARDLMGSRNIDGIVWTLEIDIKFYAVCALSVALFRRHSLALFAVPLVIGLGAIVLGTQMPTLLTMNPDLYRALWPFAFSSGFLVFMFIGTALFFAHRGYVSPLVGFLILTTLCGLTLSVWFIYPMFPLEQMWSYLLALAVFYLSCAFQSLFTRNRVTSFLANISYPLYVIHGVAGYVVLQLLVGAGFPPTLAIVVVAAVAMSIAWLIHHTVEVPMQRLGKDMAHSIYNRWLVRQPEIRHQPA